MTPEQFEHYVANLYTENGYKTKVTPLSNDWGIDVIALKGDERIGIQAKMYGGTSRSVNRRMMMELYGAAAYQDCTSAVLATDGEILSDAMLVANKLGIEVLQLSAGTDNILSNRSNDDIVAHTYPIIDESGYPSFGEVWERYIVPLSGKTITSGTLSNTIIGVSNAGITRVTSEGNRGKIGIEGFQFAYNTLLKNNVITRVYINQQVGKYCSSGIVLILGQIPFIEITSKPKGLRLKK